MNRDVHFDWRARKLIKDYLSIVRFATREQVMSCLQKDLQLTEGETFGIYAELLQDHTIVFNNWGCIELYDS